MTLEKMNYYGHEQVVFVQDESVGLRAIIAIHNTVRGPALGGTRFFNYESEEDALFDVLRLSRGMTLKNAAADLGMGGGKAVILGDPSKLKSREFFNSYGRFVGSLGGNFYTAEDINVSATDVAHINETTKYVSGTPQIGGNPGPFTARGVYLAMKAGAKERFGTDSLAGKSVAVQGIGSVGGVLCGHLAKEGAKLIVCDINSGAAEKAAKTYGATVVAPEKFLETECDILSPCAMGAVLNINNAKNLKCQIVAGAANNILLDEAAGDKLHELGILYLPDFIINAGGVINCYAEVMEGGYDVGFVNAKVEQIYDTTQKVIQLAGEKGTGTHNAANEYAEAQIK